jgi:MFS family permease
LTLRSVPADPPVTGERHIDVTGTVFLSIALTGLVFGFSQTQSWGWGSPGVIGPLVVSAVAAGLFVQRERRAQNPLMRFTLLRERPNYLGATLSQGLAGMLELGLALLFPLVLVLNLEMSPVLAGLALIPTTVPMVLLAPLAGRWYDRAGGRPPLVAGFAVLAVSGLALAWGVGEGDYLAVLPGLLLYGIGLALVLTTNDPVSVDTVPESEHGQASGVSATAEQGGGAIGIALLYALFHQTYLSRLEHLVDVDRNLKDLTAKSAIALRNALEAAEQTGLRPKHFDPALYDYLFPARAASQHGYAVAFVAASVIAVLGLIAVALLVRKVDEPDAAPQF